MSFNISDFSAHLNKTGTIQTNKFKVRIPPPKIFGSSTIDQVLEYRASSVKIPGVSFDFQNVFRYGVGTQQKMPTNIHLADIDITFIDTGNNDLWKRFAKWMNGIFDFTGTSGGSQPSYTTEYKKYYETDIQIFVYDNEGFLVNLIVLREAYPVALNDVNLSWSENNRLYQFTARFSFREWYYDGYSVSQFQSGAQIGPGQTAEVIPQRTESPRPQESPESGANLIGPAPPSISYSPEGRRIVRPGLRSPQANQNRAFEAERAAQNQ